MILRFRRLAALLALLALSVSFAEQAWAGACLGMDEHVGYDSESAHAAHGQQQASASDPASHESHRSADSPSCPMATASGMACGIVASPAARMSAPAAPEVHVRVLPAADEVPVSPSLSSPFRPPRR